MMVDRVKERLKKKAKQILIGSVMVSAIALPCVASAGNVIGVVPTHQEVKEMFKGSTCVYQDNIGYEQNNLDYQAQKKRIQTIVDKVAKAAGYDNLEIVWKSDMYNAMAEINDDNKRNPVIRLNPNMGKMYSDDDIAFVAGHEIGHHVSDMKMFYNNAFQQELGTNSGLQALSYSYYERVADKYAIGLASKAGYSPEKTTIFSTLGHYSDYDGKQEHSYYENVGRNAFPQVISAHPSNAIRKLELKDNFDNYKKDPQNYISNIKKEMALGFTGGDYDYTVEHGDVLLMKRNSHSSSLLEHDKFSRLMRDDLLSNSLLHAKSRLNDEQKEIVFGDLNLLKQTGINNFEVSVCSAELGNHVQKQFSYEDRATKDFGELLKVTTLKQTEEIYKGMQDALKEHNDIMTETVDNMDMYINENLFNELQKTSVKTQEIFDKRIKMVEKRLNELGKNIKFTPVIYNSFQSVYMDKFGSQLGYDNSQVSSYEQQKKDMELYSVSKDCKSLFKIEKSSNKFDRSGNVVLNNGVKLKGLVGAYYTDKKGNKCSLNSCENIYFVFSKNGDFSHKGVYASPMNNSTKQILNDWQNGIRKERDNKIQKFKIMNAEMLQSRQREGLKR